MNYYSKIDQAIRLINSKIAEIESLTMDEYDIIDYYGLLFALYDIKRQLMRFASAERFLRVSKEDFLNGNNFLLTGKIELTHTVKEYETPLSIAAKYNVELSDILLKNNITTDKIIPGKELIVEYESDSISKTFENIPTFGSQKDDLVLGRDLSNDLLPDGDYKTLIPTETLAQGIKNRITTSKGSYPLNQNFGIEGNGRNEWLEELSEALLTVKLSEQIEREPRISKINDITSTSKDGTLNFEIQAMTINNKLIRAGK